MMPELDDENVPSWHETKNAFLHAYVDHVLALTGGNVSASARVARVDRKHFYELCQRAGLDPASYRK